MEIKNDENLVEAPRDMGKTEETIKKAEDITSSAETIQDGIYAEAIDKSKEVDDVDEFITAPIYVGQPESVKETSSFT